MPVTPSFQVPINREINRLNRARRWADSCGEPFVSGGDRYIYEYLPEECGGIGSTYLVYLEGSASRAPGQRGCVILVAGPVRTAVDCAWTELRVPENEYFVAGDRVQLKSSGEYSRIDRVKWLWTSGPSYVLKNKRVFEGDGLILLPETHARERYFYDTVLGSYEGMTVVPQPLATRSGEVVKWHQMTLEGQSLGSDLRGGMWSTADVQKALDNGRFVEFASADDVLRHWRKLWEKTKPKEDSPISIHTLWRGMDLTPHINICWDPAPDRPKTSYLAMLEGTATPVMSAPADSYAAAERAAKEWVEQGGAPVVIMKAVARVELEAKTVVQECKPSNPGETT